MSFLRDFFARPALDAFRGLEHAIARHGMKGFVLLIVGTFLGFWIYVPFHELLHAFACLAAGGTVTKLEVAPLYGGHLLAALFPWVEAGGEYAGRLSGFDTGGSDLVYLLTDFGPFLLTLFPGVWLLRKAVSLGKPLIYGLALPVALAPFLSLTGDAYEIGSILTTQLPAWNEAATSELLRGDDLFKKVEELQQNNPAPWVGMTLATLLGALWAFATYALAGGVARLLGHGPIPPAPPPPKRKTRQAGSAT